MYKIIVEFTRNLSDDTGVLEAQNKRPTVKNLTAQFVKELQCAYDDCGMAGSFQVKKCKGKKIEK